MSADELLDKMRERSRRRAEISRCVDSEIDDLVAQIGPGRDSVEMARRMVAMEREADQLRAEVAEWKRVTGFTDAEALGLFLSRETVKQSAERIGRLWAESRAEVVALKEVLAQVQRMPELEWAQVAAGIMMRLANVSRGGNTEAALSMQGILDRGKTYVSRLAAKVERLEQALAGHRKESEVWSKKREELQDRIAELKRGGA